ncbi:TPA: hypothetical protein EYG84_02695, partial [Candidatus Gracilibacteria bacterium]|nr:hypothetical protein [Candidatus Gracilibacteria bacterium]
NNQNNQNNQNDINLKIIVAEQQEKSAYFSLEKIEENKVLLVLHNPKQKRIQSFSSEIIFPAHRVKITKLQNISKNTFGLFIKSDWKINNTKGVITIASSQTGKAKSLASNIKIATFEIEKTGNFVLDISEENTKIYMVENTKLKNIVNKTKIKDLIID